MVGNSSIWSEAFSLKNRKRIVERKNENLHAHTSHAQICRSTLAHLALYFMHEAI